MAKRSMWIALAGGLFNSACRLDFFGIHTQAALGLLAIALSWIALVFGLVALIRITSADRKAVLVPALVGFACGIFTNISVAQWERHDWAQARMRVAQARMLSPAQQMQISVSPQSHSAPKSTLKHELPFFEEIPERVIQAKAEAAQLKGEDAGMLRAWARHLERFYGAYTNTFVVSNRFHQADLLNFRLITDFNESEAIRRRGLANDYADAWHKLDDSVSTFSGSFYDDMRREQISPGRTSAEAQALFAFVDKPEVADRMAALHKFCKAEEAVGRNYNYGVSAVFEYAMMTHLTPAIGPSIAPRLREALGKVKEAEQAAAEARKEALGDSAPGR
jgi:hypothetical protein